MTWQELCEKQSHNAYLRGYAQALKEINIPMSVIIQQWKPSQCPRCNKSFEDFEPCNDGYYHRAMVMQRCPYCGQMLDWLHPQQSEPKKGVSEDDEEE